ncbi:hypothetical protein R1flu_005439 [Riccia fluitans]|uniref:Uncharacterized protein n=1 Tax=Riccia fluitans TaxID=41844 RepID=A0ABD1YTG3_9MARC
MSEVTPNGSVRQNEASVRKHGRTGVRGVRRTSRNMEFTNKKTRTPSERTDDATYDYDEADLCGKRKLQQPRALTQKGRGRAETTWDLPSRTLRQTVRDL